MVSKRRKFSFLSVVVLVLSLFGCTTPYKPPPAVEYSNVTSYKKVKLPPKVFERPSIPEDLLEPIVVYPPRDSARIQLFEKEITLSVFNLPIEDIFKAITKVSELDIIYGEGVDKSKKVSLQVRHRKLREVIDLVCKLAGYYYEVKDKTVFIKSLKTKYYDIGIPKVVAEPTIEINGNFLGTAGGYASGYGTAGGGGLGTTAGVGTGVSGSGNNIKLKYDELKNENPYKRLKDMLEKVVSPKGKFVIDEDTGILMVTDTIENLKKIDTLVHKFKYFYSKQIDVEITLIEVTYSEGKSSYIEWSAFLPKLLHGTTLSFVPVTASAMTGIVIRGAETRGKYFRITNLVLSYLKEYGDTQIVSSPRLRLTNGYSATVVAGTIQPYWRKEEEFLATGGTITVSQTGSTESEVRKVTRWLEQDYLQGTLLSVKARVNDRNEIYLVVTPVITDIIGEKSAPDGSISAPITITRQATTLLKLHDGDIVILGGLRGRKVVGSASGIPGLMEKKFISPLVSNKQIKTKETELVMVIRAKLVY